MKPFDGFDVFIPGICRKLCLVCVENCETNYIPIIPIILYPLLLLVSVLVLAFSSEHQCCCAASKAVDGAVFSLLPLSGLRCLPPPSIPTAGPFLCDIIGSQNAGRGEHRIFPSSPPPSPSHLTYSFIHLSLFLITPSLLFGH